MREFIMAHLVHVIAVATLFARIGDIGTTFLVSPTFKVEANPIAKRLGWKFAFATMGLALVPYYSLHGGIIILTVSLLVSGANACEAMLARFMGEEAYAALNRDAMRTLPMKLGLFLLCLPALFFAMLGGLMLVLSPTTGNAWGMDIAYGTFLFSTALVIFYPIRFFSQRIGPRAPLARPGQETRNPRNRNPRNR